MKLHFSRKTTGAPKLPLWCGNARAKLLLELCHRAMLPSSFCSPLSSTQFFPHSLMTMTKPWLITTVYAEQHLCQEMSHLYVKLRVSVEDARTQSVALGLMSGQWKPTSIYLVNLPMSYIITSVVVVHAIHWRRVSTSVGDFAHPQLSTFVSFCRKISPPGYGKSCYSARE